MCTVIITADKLKDHKKLGFNCCSPAWKEGMAPTFEFDGKNVPCVVGGTPKGSITSAVMAEMLKKMGDLELFDRSDGIHLFLLLDRYGSHFELRC
jgi:hypothetical protein